MILAEVLLTKKGSIHKLSLVKKPAVEVSYLKLSMQKPLKLAVNEERKEIVGAALIPDKHYYRNKEYFNNEDGGYIFFSKDTVKSIAIDFLNTSGNAINIEHKDDVDMNDISIVESWIVETENDKAYALGFTKDEIPIGTWMVTQRINDEDLWEKVKKDTNGYSIEGKFAVNIIRENIEMAINEDFVANEIVNIIKNYIKI